MSDQAIVDVVDYLIDEKLSVALAESCTGGLIAAMFADVPACGQVLDRSYVVYSSQAKTDCLDVRPWTIEHYGLTSEEVAREMAEGALRHSGAVLALANTGTAEGESDSDGKICIAYAWADEGRHQLASETVRFSGDRNEVRKQAARHAILSLPAQYRQLKSAAAKS